MSGWLFDHLKAPKTAKKKATTAKGVAFLSCIAPVQRPTLATRLTQCLQRHRMLSFRAQELLLH